MLILAKTLLVTALFVTFIQDQKERRVYWFLFPIIGVLGGLLFYNKVSLNIFLTSVGVNLLIVGVLLLVIFLYAKFKLKIRAYKAIGLGDIFLFLAATVCFTYPSFIVLFVSALIFSLILHLYKTRDKKQDITVPLAGYMCLFFLVCFSANWLGIVNNLYVI